MIKYIFIFLSLVFADDVLKTTIENVKNGNLDGAEKILLKYQGLNPNNSSTMYLDALLEIDGIKAKDKFLELYKRHGSSRYADDSVMKIAEFYYTSGSYVKAAEWLKRIPLFYSRSEYVDHAVKLFLNSQIVSGNKDSAIYYAKVFKKQFPNMNVDEKMKDLISINSKQATINNEPVDVVGSIKNIFSKVKEEITSPLPTGNYSIQIGAYGNSKNADSQKNMLTNAGLDARVEKLITRNLFAVRVGYYSSKDEAKDDLRKINSIINGKAIVIEVN